jgi:rod shape-determining protein MreC
MESVLGRYRNLIVLVAVLFVQVLGLAVQVKRTTDSEPTRLIRVWAVGSVTPLEKALHWIQTSTSGIWHNYLYLRGVRAENRELKQEIQQIRLEQVRMSQDADQARRLQALLSFKEQFISQTVAAQVIGSSGSEQSRAVYIDKGAREGIKPDMAVITKDGIVGKVLSVYGTNPIEPSTSQILLINDQTSGVGVILDKTRLQGILRGTPSGEVTLEKVMSDETVATGDLVLTSGGDGIFPKGLPVGTVTKVTPGNDLFLNIRVRPAANLNRLEEVLIVTKIDERQAQPEQAGPVRAVDILAERLPTVPPKPDATLAGANKNAVSPSVTTGGSAAGTTPAASVATPGTTKPKSGGGSAAPNGATASTNAAGQSPANVTTPKVFAPGQTTTVGTPHSASANSVNVGSSGSGNAGVIKPVSPTTSPTNSLLNSATTTTKAATKPVNSTGTPKPQPAAQDTPQ